MEHIGTNNAKSRGRIFTVRYELTAFM